MIVIRDSIKSNAGTTDITQIYPGPMKIYGYLMYWYKNVLGEINAPTYLWHTHTHVPIKFV